MAPKKSLQDLMRSVGSLSGADLMAAAEARGWLLARVRGSHHIYRKPGWPVVVSIPLGASKANTLRAILRQLIEEEDHGEDPTARSSSDR